MPSLEFLRCIFGRCEADQHFWPEAAAADVTLLHIPACEKPRLSLQATRGSIESRFHYAVDPRPWRIESFPIYTELFRSHDRAEAEV